VTLGSGVVSAKVDSGKGVAGTPGNNDSDDDVEGAGTVWLIRREERNAELGL
jgi:hypothetical protein